MKMTAKDIVSALMAFGVLAVIGSHFLVNKPTNEEIVLLEAEVVTQTAERDRLKGVEARLEIMVDEIEANKKIIENELTKYPEEILTESFVMYAENMRNSLEISIDSANITAPSLLNTMELVRSIEDQDVNMTVASYLSTLSFGFKFSYAQLKSFLDYVHAERERTVVNALNFAYDGSNGQLSGTAVIHKYQIATPNYEYEPEEDIPMGSLGTDNPFGTILGGSINDVINETLG